MQELLWQHKRFPELQGGWNEMWLVLTSTEVRTSRSYFYVHFSIEKVPFWMHF